MQNRNHPAPPIIIAHRGASAEAPENTIAAFQRAKECKAHFVELDVRLTQDGVPVVFHDDCLSRITGLPNSSAIHQLSHSALQTVDAGRYFGVGFENHRIPTLAEVLELDWSKTGLMIEIKECFHPAPLVVQSIFNVLMQAKHLPSSLVIGSFSLPIYQEAQKLRGMLKQKVDVIGIVEDKEMLQQFVEQKALKMALCHTIISHDVMEFMNGKGVDVWTFTVDDVETAKNLNSLGVKGIITNHPAQMLQNWPPLP